MATTFGLLINANVKGENNIKRLGNSMQGVQGKVKNLKMAVGGLSTAFKALGAALVVGGFSSFIKSTIDQADALGKLSTRTGIAANSLQAFVNAGKLADVSQKQLETGLKSFARTSYEAGQGVATYADAYASLGVDVKKADGSLKASDDLLKEIADKFQDLPNGPEKAAIAMRLFGKSGADMITLLNGGSEALERFNYEVSDNFSQNAEYFNDQITILQIQFDGFRKQLLDALLPALNAILEVFGDLFSSGQDFGPLFKVIEVGIRGVASVVLGLVQSMRFFVRTIRDLLSIAQLVVQRKFGAAVDVAKTGLADTRGQFFKDIAAQQKVLFGRSEVGADYGGGGRGAFIPRTVSGAAAGRGRQEKTPEEKAAEARQKAADEYEKMLQKLMGTAAEFKTITIDAIQVTENQATGFDAVRNAAATYLEAIGSVSDGVANLAGVAFKGLEDSLVSLVVNGTTNFRDFARSMIEATARMIIQTQVLARLMQLIGMLGKGPLPTSPFGGPQVVSGGTGLDGSAFGAAAFSKNLPISGYRARGGPVRKGKGYIVGENGPEYFKPGERGEIISNEEFMKYFMTRSKFPLHPMMLAAMAGTGNFGGRGRQLMQYMTTGSTGQTSNRFAGLHPMSLFMGSQGIKPEIPDANRFSALHPINLYRGFMGGNAIPRANGGPVASGSNYLVGERGPELFISKNSMGKGGSIGNVVVNVDAQGTQVQGDQPNANKLGEALGAAVRAELIRQKRPGGLLG